MCGELDLLVTPLGRPVLARDQAGSMDPAKVPIDECVSALGLVGRFVVEAEVPFGILVPGVSFEERVLIIRSGLNLAPFALEHVLASVDETPSVGDRAVID